MPSTCQRCGKRPATVHVTEVAPQGGHGEAHLCSACCQEAGWSPALPPPPVGELVAAGKAEAAEDGGDEAEACPTCGLTLADYQQVNLLGCAHDWIRFQEPLRELVRRWHGAVRHVGRRPGDTAPVAAAVGRRAELEAELAAAVAGERYEEAARLRDQLRRLEPS